MIRERRSVAGGLVALGVLSLVCLAGCGTAVEEDLGTISVALQAGSGGPTVTRIHADIAPGGVGLDLTYDAGSGTWRGSVVTTAGAKTIDATAYAGAVVVGTGTASL